MDKQIITFSANEQHLHKTGGLDIYASKTVSYIEAHFDLGQNWSGYDSVNSVWWNDYVRPVPAVLNAEGVCEVPAEVLMRKGTVYVNLVGSISSGNVLTDRLTTIPITAFTVKFNAQLGEGTATPLTPSQFEQFVSIVRDEVANIKDIVSTTLNADYTLTFVYSDGTSYTTPSIRGERGPQGADGSDGTDGNGIASAVLNSNYTLTLTFTDGTSYTTPSIRGPQGPKGDPGDVSYADLKSLLPMDTASGAIVSITDGQSVIPVDSLKVSLEPTQSGSGTPSPTNIRPISGHTEVDTHRTGKNLFDGVWESGAINNSGQPIASTASIRAVNLLGIKGNNRYALSWGGGLSLYILVFAYHKDGSFARYIGAIVTSGGTFMTNEGEAYLRFYTYNNTTEPTEMQLELDTATDYEPYQGDTYHTELGQTVYAGVLDVVSGELVVDRAMVTLDGSNDEVWNTQTALPNAFSYVDSSIKDGLSQASVHVLSNYLEGKTQDKMASPASPYGVAQFAWGTQLVVRIPNITSLTDLKAYLAQHPLQVVYELATPTTIQLTPQEVKLLLGNNTIWSDGDVAIVYSADVGLYIDKKLGITESAEGSDY